MLTPIQFVVNPTNAATAGIVAYSTGLSFNLDQMVLGCLLEAEDDDTVVVDRRYCDFGDLF
jgi:hypothetical protein